MEHSPETRTNVGGRMFGSYPATVVSVDHPDGLFMAKIRLNGLWASLSDDVLPWAEFLLPLGAKSEAGHAIPVEADDIVWVDFPRNGDTRYPRITGSVYYAPDNKSYLPTEITGEGLEPKRADGEPTPPDYSAKDDIYSRFGLMERKTAGGGWILTHRDSGTAIEITEDGQHVIHVEGAAYRSAESVTEQVTKNMTVTIGKDLNVTVSGAANLTLKGDTEVTVKGAATINVGGDATVKADGALALNGESGITMETGGTFQVTAAKADFVLG